MNIFYLIELQQFVTNNKLYVTSFNFLRYSDAENYCKALVGHLPRPTEIELQNINIEWHSALKTVLSLTFGYNYYFLDAKSENEHKEFFSSNGERCPLQDTEIWDVAQIYYQEGCRIAYSEGEGLWISSCDLHGRVLCEIRTRKEAR